MEVSKYNFAVTAALWTLGFKAQASLTGLSFKIKIFYGTTKF